MKQRSPMIINSRILDIFRIKTTMWTYVLFLTLIGNAFPTFAPFDPEHRLFSSEIIEYCPGCKSGSYGIIPWKTYANRYAYEGAQYGTYNWNPTQKHGWQTYPYNSNQAWYWKSYSPYRPWLTVYRPGLDRPTWTLRDCFKFMDAGRILNLHYNLRSINTRSMDECMQECYRDRDCWTIAYSRPMDDWSASSRDDRNCQLGSRLQSSQIRELERQARWDIYERVDSSHCRDYSSRPTRPDDGDCFMRLRVGSKITNPDETLDARDERDCENICRRTSRCEGYSFRMSGSGSMRDYRNCLLSRNRYLSIRDLRDDYDYDTYIRTSARECRDNGRPDRIEDRTVNNQRCYSGCKENREGGYFYCELDRGNTWDFCCAPGERCKPISRDYGDNYPMEWCYVGKVTVNFKPRRPCHATYEQYDDYYYRNDRDYYRTPTDGSYYYYRRFPLHSKNDTIVDENEQKEKE